MINLAICGITYNLFDMGLANTLCVETLRHGTNPINYLSICLFGGLTSHGAKATGSTWTPGSTENKFYVFKDSEFFAGRSWFIFGCHQSDLPWLVKRTLPKGHLGLSTYALVAGLLPQTAQYAITRLFIGTIGALIGLLITPTLKFRYAPSELTQFVNDPQYGGAAYYSTTDLSPWRLGITGSLISGLNSGLPSRIAANPYKCGTGLLQLALAVSLIAYILRSDRFKSWRDTITSKVTTRA